MYYFGWKGHWESSDKGVILHPTGKLYRCKGDSIAIYPNNRFECGRRNEYIFRCLSNSIAAASISAVGGVAYNANTSSAMFRSCRMRREFVPARTAADTSSGFPADCMAVSSRPRKRGNREKADHVRCKPGLLPGLAGVQLQHEGAIVRPLWL